MTPKKQTPKKKPVAKDPKKGKKLRPKQKLERAQTLRYFR
jgi:hypothetical protein